MLVNKRLMTLERFTPDQFEALLQLGKRSLITAIDEFYA